MMLLSDARARGGMLILALAFVGGTGCAVIDAASQAHYRQQQQDAEAARQRRIAALAPAAEHGDAAARSALAYALLSPSDAGRADAPRALALLEQAAAQDDGLAQALLGVILSGARVGTYQRFPTSQQDLARAMALLQRAATKACVYQPGPAYFRIEPTQRAAQILDGAGRRDEARLWRARAILHCGGANVSYLSWQAKSASVAPAQRTDALALLTLTGDAKAIAEARAALSPADAAAAAERLAVDLRREVAASERDYPAPPRKEYP
jgi:hypothetical protein